MVPGPRFYGLLSGTSVAILGAVIIPFSSVLAPITCNIRIEKPMPIARKTLVNSVKPAAEIKKPVAIPASLKPIAPYLHLVISDSHEYGIAPSLVASVIMVESGGDQDATSTEGAEGLMQVLPIHADMCAYCDLYNPASSISVGTRLLVGYAHEAGASTACLESGPNSSAGCAWDVDMGLSYYNWGYNGFNGYYVSLVRRIWPSMHEGMSKL